MQRRHAPRGGYDARMAELYRRRYSATRDAVPRARHDIIATLTQAGLTDARLHANVALAVSEATGNAVRHAYSPAGTDGHVEVTVTRATDILIVTVKDEGSGMDNSMPTEGGGLGLSIMSAQTRDLAIESNETGTTVKLRFRI
jgi:anti-sigma regulatory factor (Ser/Thr protein kinase)